MVRKSFRMNIARNRTISIEGSIVNVDVTHDEFLDEFTKWLDSKDWGFMGYTNDTEEDAGERLKHILENMDESEKD